MGILDKIAKVQAARPSNNNNKVTGIYYSWKEGTNRIRLAGDFLEVRTHFIAPSPKRKDRGLCFSAAFQGDEKIPQVVNCQNWDVESEHGKSEKTCPICKLNAVARAALTEAPGDEEKKFFEDLKSSTRPQTVYKWNIIDRDDPYVTASENGKDTQVLGYKIASIGREAFDDICGIMTQVGYDITDPDKGIDIEVIKDSKGARTTYSARAVLSGVSLKVTPMTEEERKLELHDLKIRCGKQTPSEKIVASLHDDLRDILNLNLTEADGDDEEEALEKAISDVEAPVKKAKVVKMAGADDDDIMGGTNEKKK
jgi:hypothetical protein